MTLRTGTDNTWNHTWTEVDRRVTYRPFRLMLQSGEEVHVEPDASVFLVDSLDEKARRAVDHRTMASELVGGEEAYACGIVHTTKHVDPHAGYRGGMVSHRVLRSPPTGKLLLSTEPLANRFKSRFWFHVRWAIGACLALALLHGVVFFDYHLRVLRGQRVDAEVTQLTITERTGGRARVEHNVIVYAASRGEQYKVDAALRSYSQLAKGTPVELVVVDGWPSATQFGGTVTVNLLHALLSLWGVFIFTHAFVVSREGSKPWYDKKKVIDGGAGRLFETWHFNATPKTR